jgi:hypothetical protein
LTREQFKFFTSYEKTESWTEAFKPFKDLQGGVDAVLDRDEEK